MLPITLTTPRLVIRSVLESDALELFAACSDARLTETTIFETHRTMEDTKAFIAQVTGPLRNPSGRRSGGRITAASRRGCRSPQHTTPPPTAQSQPAPRADLRPYNMWTALTSPSRRRSYRFHTLKGMTTFDKPGVRSRTFAGLLVAQFTAAFNDQALHAAAMFFAINTRTLADKDAIALLPVLFYAPWAAFCTLTGYVADRFSKRTVLLTWKWLEVGITALATLGFWLGSSGEPAGVWLVLGCVTLMGTHAAFFGPAKYGLMPEILPPHQMSRGNGWLECLSFLAVIFGTVSGGALSFACRGDEWLIGVLLGAFAAVGTVCCYWIRPVPAAHPARRFPHFVYVPIVAAVRDMWVSPGLRLALVGIALFTGLATFLRSAMYLLGETRLPRWDELTTSAVVGTIAVGIGLGSPVAGYLSGHAIRPRLILLGGAGMTVACLLAGFSTQVVPLLVACIVVIGFFAGFYLVPLFTLLQSAGPKETKGVMVATSNFVDVFGAVASSLAFYGVVSAVRASGVPDTDAPRWLFLAAAGLIVLCLLWLRGMVRRVVKSEPEA